MENFKLYYITDKYINYIKEYDTKVLYNKNTTRPYVGVIILHNDISYFAPLSSPKIKHIAMNDNKPDIYKIDNGHLGIININNMIPTPISELIEINLNKQGNSLVEIKYLIMLKNQVQFLNNNKSKVLKKVEKFFKLYLNNQLFENIRNRTCNFELLEEKCKEYLEE